MAGNPRPFDVNDNIRSARNFIERLYGLLAITVPRVSNYTIGTSVVPLGTMAFQRLGFICSNTGSVNIAVSYDPAVTITTGVLLLEGGTFQSTWFFDLEQVTYPLYAIGANSGATLCMIEQILQGA